MSKKVLIDTDPGVDDAMAILFALRSPELEVIALTTVFGNARCGAYHAERAAIIGAGRSSAYTRCERR
jgi:inosine-uridine nucleoside N-ribohydrolase